jgi:pentalenic acid synthase
VTRHQDVQAVLTDPRVSADATRPGFPSPTALQNAPVTGIPFVRMDSPQHTTYRRLLAPEFTAKRVKTMQADIQSIADSALARMLAGGPPADLVAAFAVPVPSLVTCRLLGLPDEDFDFFERKSAQMVSRDSTLEESSLAMAELRDRLDSLVVDKLDNPGDDLTSRLAGEALRCGQFSRDELVTTILFLVNASHETTSNMISLGTLALLEHPCQLAALLDDPSLLPNAVDQLMRYLSIADMTTPRIAVEDIEIGGTLIRAGDGIIPLLGSANRDPEAFQEPDQLDITCEGRRHVAFGHGAHRCLGERLARLQLEIALGSLFQQVPSLRVATAVDTLPFKHQGLLWGLHELPVTWSTPITPPLRRQSDEGLSPPLGQSAPRGAPQTI